MSLAATRWTNSALVFPSQGSHGTLRLTPTRIARLQPAHWPAAVGADRIKRTSSRRATPSRDGVFSLAVAFGAESFLG